MWSSKPVSKFIAAGLMALALAGCFRPLNGEFGKDNSTIAKELALVDVEPIHWAIFWSRMCCSN